MLQLIQVKTYICLNIDYVAASFFCIHSLQQCMRVYMESLKLTQCIEWEGIFLPSSTWAKLNPFPCWCHTFEEGSTVADQKFFTRCSSWNCTCMHTYILLGRDVHRPQKWWLVVVCGSWWAMKHEPSWTNQKTELWISLAFGSCLVCMGIPSIVLPQLPYHCCYDSPVCVFLQFVVRFVPISISRW